MTIELRDQDFREKAIILHHWRQRLAQLRADVAAKREQFETENAQLLAALTEAQGSVGGHEQALRTLTVAVYRETGNKRPWPGVGVRVEQRLSYQAETALAWAKEHGLALALDVPAFKAIAKVQPLEFVRIEPEPVATIAQELGAFLDTATRATPSAMTLVPNQPGTS